MADKFPRNFGKVVDRIDELKTTVIPMMKGKTEQHTRTNLETTFKTLGWNFENHSIIQEDFVGDGYSDYIMGIPKVGAQNIFEREKALENHERLCLMESKPYGTNINLKKYYDQVMDYNKKYKTYLVWVTDGRKFCFYNAKNEIISNSELDIMNKRKITDLDILLDSNGDCLSKLWALSPNKISRLIDGQVGGVTNNDFFVCWQKNQMYNLFFNQAYTKMQNPENIQKELEKLEKILGIRKSGIGVQDISSVFKNIGGLENIPLPKYQFCEEEFSAILDPNIKYVISIFGQIIVANKGESLKILFQRFISRLISLGYITPDQLPIDSFPGKKSILNTKPKHPDGTPFVDDTKLQDRIFVENSYNNSYKCSTTIETQMCKIMEELQLDLNYVEILKGFGVREITKDWLLYT